MSDGIDVAIADAVDAYLQRKAVGDPDSPGAGTYAANAESILRRFAEWAEREHGVTAIRALEASHMQSYAGELRDRADEGTYTASTAHTYYAVVRAFLSWCVRGGILAENPATVRDAESELPTTTQPVDEDRWTADSRRKLERYVRERALEGTPSDADKRRNRLREYAMVALLAHSAVRGSELFRVPEDDRRTGATWDDVDFYTGTIRVLGKSQRQEDVTLLAPARTPLRRYGVVLDPPSNDWPLFPTRHAPSIASRVRKRLRERGHGDEEVEALLEGNTATELARERAIAPPAITTEGARSVLKRLCREAGVEVDGDYLTPRGVRAEPDDDDRYRRDATPSTPALRTSVPERAIAVPESRTEDRLIRDIGARDLENEET
ncbi:tyrosine-type recombinase/integrase [Natronobacterium gregoryi]|uniref:Recombinase XerD n=2 Tax=Natronobacterium gregoryi TaxID=44930 RepID=L0AKP2_NATGS|nr:site-specific integrase [Natronobacterium gregoryi]AFZ74376.1 site-specific recombinase XerD [Natronobacterium gregoryi SP2]ELY74123.1 Site-specific recombinase XerD-like protein [Natronobacterium gregoryi SP2]PLK22114.1 recombinase XerD [Natronobacterium gregoryi SP2]SFJ61243.1 Phage integrase, N-terminal SAM-like domain [Natronobacterium gregoryi]